MTTLTIDDKLCRIFDQEAREQNNVVALSQQKRDVHLIRTRVREAGYMRSLSEPEIARCITLALDSHHLGHSLAWAIGLGTKRAENIARDNRMTRRDPEPPQAA